MRRLPQLKAGLVLVALLLAPLCSPASFAADPIVVMIEEGHGSDIVRTYQGGAHDFVGTTGHGDLRGITWDDTTQTLFGVSRSSDRLLTIDLDTGIGTEVSGANYLPPGSNTSGITTADAGQILGLGHIGDMSTVDTLLDVDKVAGTATAIGSFGLLINSLAYDRVNDRIYGITFGGDLYDISLDGTTLTFLGDTFGAAAEISKIAIDHATGTLYGTTNGSPGTELTTIDLNTLEATVIATVPNSSQLYAITVISTDTASIGGTATGVRRIREVSCENRRTGQVVSGGAAGRTWSCGVLGLIYNSGDEVLVDLTSIAGSRGTIGGSVELMTPRSVRCRNITTGQTVEDPSGPTSWNCEALGLVVADGDRIRMQIRGRAD